MGLFRFNWLHRLIRRHTTPIDEETALKWRHRLSIAYMLIGWNALGIVIYMVATGKGDWPDYYGIKPDEEKEKRPGVYYAELLGMQKAKVITIKGFTKVDEFDFVNPKKIETKETLQYLTENRKKKILDAQSKKMELKLEE